MSAFTSLSLNGLQLPVFLGVYPQEWEQKCLVNIDLKLKFPHPPQGCETDILEQAHCYDAIITLLKTTLGERKFKLIEYLSREIHACLKSYLPPQTRISVRLTKFPPIPELSQGATFEYSDE